MSHQEQIIVNELDKNPNIRITDLENMTGLPIGEVCKIRYFWKREKKRESRQYVSSSQGKEDKPALKQCYA
jgi:predicted deacetylase